MIAGLITVLLFWHLPFQQTEDVRARFNHAVELQRQGSWSEAAAEYRQLLAAAPNYAEAQANLGAVLPGQSRHSRVSWHLLRDTRRPNSSSASPWSNWVATPKQLRAWSQPYRRRPQM